MQFLLAIFLVFGPLGIPFIWRNPTLSRGMKWILTGVTALYTLWLIQLGIKMMQDFNAAMSQATSGLNF